MRTLEQALQELQEAGKTVEKPLSFLKEPRQRTVRSSPARRHRIGLRIDLARDVDCNLGDGLRSKPTLSGGRDYPSRNRRRQRFEMLQIGHAVRALTRSVAPVGSRERSPSQLGST